MSKYIFLKKKIILGKTKKIYTKKESKKEYVKYKNCMINIAKYKKIKNNKGKKMKGGARGPSLFRRRTSKSGPSFSTSSSDIMYRKLYASENNVSDVTKRINDLKLSNSNSSETSRIRFGQDKTHTIPSSEDTLDDSMSDLNLTSSSSLRRHSLRSTGPRSLLFQRPPYKRSSSSSLASGRSILRRSTSRRSVRSTLQE